MLNKLILSYMGNSLGQMWLEKMPNEQLAFDNLSYDQGLNEEMPLEQTFPLKKVLQEQFHYINT